MDVCYSILKNLAMSSKENNLENSCDFSTNINIPLSVRKHSVEESLKLFKPQRLRSNTSLQQSHGIWIENSTQLPENVKLILLFLFFLILISSIH